MMVQDVTAFSESQVAEYALERVIHHKMGEMSTHIRRQLELVSVVHLWSSAASGVIPSTNARLTLR